MSREISSLSEISNRYSSIIVDVWGVLCDGVNAHGPAKDALSRYRENGHVILLSNTARSVRGLGQFLDSIGITSSLYDGIVTAGQLCRDSIQASGLAYKSIYHLGSEDDLQIFADTAVPFCSTLADASALLCTGPNSNDSDLSKEFETMARAISLNMPMICANPDLYVQVGNKTIPCAGILAAQYGKMGGAVQYFGKPYGAIYDQCWHHLRQAGISDDPGNILAIGDTIATDIYGAQKVGIQSLFIRNSSTLDCWDVEPHYHMTYLA